MRQLLTVFLASPSDLKREREIVREVVRQLNRPIRDINWSVELLGWEDTLPSFGRPQSRINLDLEKCQLFIGLLWRRWGTRPALSGEYTSGFEEEFYLAQERHEATGTPEICMFFKQVDPEQLQDPGPQLQRVQSFRQKIAEERVCLFREFANLDQWKEQLHELLLRHVLRLHKMQESAPARALSPVATVGAQRGATAARSAGQQIEAFARALTPCFLSADLRDVETSELVSIRFFAARSLLLAHGATKVFDRSYRPIPTHELNTLYQHRRHLDATDTEKDALFETMVADDGSVAPGWFWLDPLTRQNIQSVLFRTLATVDNHRAKKNILDMLRFTDSSELTSERRSVLEHELTGYAAADLHSAAWRFLVATATSEDLDVLKNNAGGTWVEPRLDWLLEWVARGRDLESFILDGHDTALFPLELHDDIVARIPSLSTAAIEHLTVLRSKQVLQVAISELTQRGVQVSDELRLAAMAKNSLLDLFKDTKPQATESSDSDEARYVRLTGQSSEALEEALNWVELDSAVAYQIQVERGHIDHETARADIASKFERLRESFVEGLLQLAKIDEHTGEEIQKLLASIDSHRESFAADFSEKALKGIAVNPTQGDVELARHMLSQYRTRLAAIRIIAEVGGEADIELLIKVAETSFGPERAQALAAVRKLFHDDRQAFSTMFSSTSIELRCFAAWLVWDLPEEEAVKIAERLLIHPDESVRVCAGSYLGEKLTKTALEQLLEEYLNRDEYYYNVVTWFDRYLYAPTAALRAYKEGVRNPWHTSDSS